MCIRDSITLHYIADLLRGSRQLVVDLLLGNCCNGFWPVQVMRKKLKDKDAELAECRTEIRQRENELMSKERVIAERDSVIGSLQQQIAQLNVELQSSMNDNSESSVSTSAFTTDTEVGNLDADQGTGHRFTK